MVFSCLASAITAPPVISPPYQLFCDQQAENALAITHETRYGVAMDTASEIITFIGRARVEAAFGVSKRSVDQWMQFNVIPSLYYHGLERMAGRPLPRGLFSFKDPAE
jgi:hypothetical protein